DAVASLGPERLQGIHKVPTIVHRPTSSTVAALSSELVFLALRYQLGCNQGRRLSTTSPGDDVSLQRYEDRGQLTLLARRNTEFIERPSEILHEGIEVGVANAKPTMCRPHVAAAVATGTAARLADLLDQQTLEARDVCGAEEAIDTAVLGNVLNKVLDHQSDGGLAAEPTIERAVMHRRVRGRRQKQDGDCAGC